MSRRAGALIALCMAVAASPAIAETVFVEGHVFDMRTGAPVALAGVVIFAPGSTHQPVIIIGKPGSTDGSGFYTIELELDSIDRNLLDVLDISASCLKHLGVRTTDRLTNRLRLRPGTVRRDFYIGGLPHRRGPIRCLSPSSLEP